MDSRLMLELAAQFEAVASTLRHAAASETGASGLTWTEEEAVARARMIYPSLGTAQEYAVRVLARSHPEGVTATMLAVNPSSMPNTYHLLDNKLGPAGVVRCDDGYPRKYYLGFGFDLMADGPSI